MYKNRGFIGEKGNEIIKKVIGAMSFRAFAEEPEPSNEGGDGGSKQTPTINYEDLIAKARKEEKEKQYKTIEKLKGQIDTLTQQHNNDLLKVADLEKQLQEANTKLTTAGSGDSEEVKTLKESVKGLEKAKKDLEEKVKEFESQTPVNRDEVVAEVKAELEKEYEVKHYKATKLMELKDDLLVPELVFGNSKEEIDASIQSALERSNEIKKNLGIGDTKQKRTPKTSAPSISKVQETEVSMERLATMDVRSPEYAELRKQLGLR